MAPWKQEEGCQGQLSQEEVFRQGQDAMKAPLGCCLREAVVGQHSLDLKTIMFSTSFICIITNLT